jgi:thiol-disulfide isomerase/thioredoxin
LTNRLVLLLALFCIFLSQGPVGAETKPIGKGARFSDLTFPNNLSAKERSYLGLSGKAKFSLRDVKGRLLLIEVFNTYCTICPQNVPVLNDLYSSVESDARLKEKVKVIAIAVGNTANEVAAFKKEYRTFYPVLTDVDYAVHKAMGNPRVPYTVLLSRNAKGDVVLDTRQGVLNSSNALLDKIKDFLFQ